MLIRTFLQRSQLAAETPDNICAFSGEKGLIHYGKSDIIDLCAKSAFD